MRILIAGILCLFFAAPAIASEETDKAALEFVKNLQRMLRDNKRDEIAKLIDYPLLVDGEATVKDAAAFVREYDSIVTSHVGECAQNHDTGVPMEQVKAAYMVGPGCIWFEPDDTNAMTIFAVNTGQ